VLAITKDWYLPSCLDWQRSLLKERVNNPSLDDVLILLEHPPVYTLGQGARQNSSFDPDKANWDVYRWSEGRGDVPLPWHFGYPILNLQHYRKDLHWYLRQLEEVLIRVLAVYRLRAIACQG